LKYPGPTRLDYGLAPPRPKPLAPDPDNPPGPTVVPGSYAVELTAAGKKQAQKFTVVKDPRLPTTPEEYAAQFKLHREIIASISKLKAAVNSLRLMKRQLAEIEGRNDKVDKTLRSKAAAIVRKLGDIEKVMVDPERKSVRDVLRNPAGLNDTLMDMVAMATTADRPPTSQTQAVSREVMAKVDSEVAKFEKLVAGEIAQLNAALAKARVRHLAAA
jgi:hypothetical protein